MDATDIVIEYLRRKLKGSQQQAAGAVLKPASVVEEEAPVEMSPEDLAMLEAMEEEKE